LIAALKAINTSDKGL